jgi:hypothetical protein
MLMRKQALPASQYDSNICDGGRGCSIIIPRVRALISSGQQVHEIAWVQSRSPGLPQDRSAVGTLASFPMSDWKDPYCLIDFLRFRRRECATTNQNASSLGHARRPAHQTHVS